MEIKLFLSFKLYFKKTQPSKLKLCGVHRDYPNPRDAEKPEKGTFASKFIKPLKLWQILYHWVKHECENVCGPALLVPTGLDRKHNEMWPRGHGTFLCEFLSFAEQTVEDGAEVSEQPLAVL